jgi:hypothetical protein
MQYETILGDEWDGIAHKVYGDRVKGEMLMHLLLAANHQHRETVIFGSGVVLDVPPSPVGRISTLPPWKR